MLRIAIFILFIFQLHSLDFRKVFHTDYVSALDFISENSSRFYYYSDTYQTDPEIIMSVLFPEAIRYSIVKDFFEIRSLEIAYVYSGTTDFSIGYFQMKPSFAEELENQIKEYPSILKKYNVLLLSENQSIIEARKIRVARLKDIDYQILYANCFYDVLRIIYPSAFNLDRISQIRFISTAYNHGFLAGFDEIQEYSSKAFFPLNGKNNTQKYVYNEVSVYFYENDLPQIISKKDNFALLFK